MHSCTGVDTSHLLPLKQLRSIRLTYATRLDHLPALLSQQQHPQLTLLHFVPDIRRRSAWEELVEEEHSMQLCAPVAPLAGSTCLRHLSLAHFTFSLSAWRHIFAAGHQLPGLTCLVAPMGFYKRDGSTPLQCWEPADVQAVVACCPALQRLDAEYLLHMGPELGGLKAPHAPAGGLAVESSCKGSPKRAHRAATPHAAGNRSTAMARL